MNLLAIRLKRRLAHFTLEVDVECPYPVTAVFGPSGAGKTTLLNLVAGLLRPDNGEVRIDDELLFSSAAGIELPPERRRIGYVFQEDLLFPHLTVERNLRYGYDLLTPAQRRFDLDQIVALLEIEHLLYRHPGRLSGGERQRVALGRALLSSPRLLLMDEPLVSLDQGLKNRIIPYLRHIRTNLGIPILYVSHSVAEILELTGQVIVLDRGKVLACGDFFRIARQPEVLPLVETQGIENVLQTELIVSDEGAGISRVRCCGREWEIPFCDRPAGTRIFIGVRAEDIILCRHRPRGLSALNAVPGHILGISGSGSTRLVYVDVGVRVAVKVTPGSIDQLHLKAGEGVICLVKIHSIRIGPEVE